MTSPGDRITGAVPPQDQDAWGFTLEDVHSGVSPSKSLCPSKTPRYPVMRSPVPHGVTCKDIQTHLPKLPMGGHPPPTPNPTHISPTPLWAPRHPVQPRSRHGSICGVFIAT